MRTTGYAAHRGPNPGGMAMALGATGLVMLGLATAAPKIIEKLHDTTLTVDNIDIPPPPPPKLPDPEPKLTKAPPEQLQFQRVDPIIVTPIKLDTGITTSDLVNLHPDPGPPAGAGGGVVVEPPKPPVLVNATIDPRHFADFQPFYPPSERQIGREGRVVVRVLIGTDGRVHAIEPVSATSDAFFDATRRRALQYWRFTPATRDGMPIESWKQMTVSFHLEDAQ